MSGFDGLVDARSKQISDLVRRTSSNLVPGTGRSEWETTAGEKFFGVLGAPEEILTKAIGKLYSDSNKYDFSKGIGHYHTQTSFGDLFRDSGMDHGLAATLGIGAALINPLDPLNKLKFLELTQVGKAAEVVAKASDNLVKGADDLWRLSKETILHDIAKKEKALAEGLFEGDMALLTKQSIKNNKAQLSHVDELNGLLEEVQKRGVDLKSLRLASSTYERVLQGQQHLIGLGSPTNPGHIPFVQRPNDVSIFGLGGKASAALVKSVTGLKNKITKPLSDGAYKVADYLGIANTRGEKAKDFSLSVQKIMDHSNANMEEKTRDLLSTYRSFLADYGPEGLEQGKQDMLAVLQSLELRHSGAKEMAIEELSKINHVTEVASGVVIKPDPEKFYRGFETPDEVDKKLRHMDKGKIWNDAFVIEMSGDQKAYNIGANNTYRGRIDPSKVERIFYDINSYENYPTEYIKELKKKFPNAEVVDVKLNDQEELVTVGRQGTKVPSSLPRGKGVDIGEGKGLTDEQKLRLTPTGLEQSEIPVAVGQFDESFSPSIRLGIHKQHEAKILGRYVVVKTSDAKAAVSKLDDLDGIYGQRIWSKHPRGDETFLVQRRHPGVSRISKAEEFEPVHLRNLEAIAAQLASKQKGFTKLSAEDLLISRSGAVQIINPSVITDYKSGKQAVANSREALDSLAESLSVPRGSAREFPFLRNTKTARAVPKGVDGFSFRVAKTTNIGQDLVYVPAYDLLEQAVNTEGHKMLVRGQYGQIDPNAVTDFERQFVTEAENLEQNNNVAFHRKQIREAVAKGQSPDIEPVSITVDDSGNMHIASGRDRLTAAILEGYETVPVYKKNFIGDKINAEAGFYTGKTSRLVDLWNPAQNASAAHLVEGTRGIVAPNYGLVQRNGEVKKLTTEDLKVNPQVGSLLNRIATLGPQFVGKSRNQRVESVIALLTKNFGSYRNGLIRVAEVADSSTDLKSFIGGVESLLVNQETGRGIRLDNALRHTDTQLLYEQLKGLSSQSLDDLATNGLFTTSTVNDTRRLLLASDSDLVVQVMDPNTNTLRVLGNGMSTAHLKSNAEAFINSTTSAADVEPYAKIQLVGADGTKTIEVKDLVKGQHPRLTDVIERKKVFEISKEYKDVLKENGIFVSDTKNTESVRQELKDKGLDFGVLLQAKHGTVARDGNLIEKTAVVRPEFTFFATRSGALVIGTKQRNVKDLIQTVFEEGPAYFEEFGVMTTGKIIVSNPYGSKMEKIGIGEVKLLQDRLTELAQKFTDLGFSKGTVLDVRVPFDDAVWRSMYGERVTIGDILDPKYKIKIPQELKGMSPDLRILAPGRLGAEAKETGVVGLEKTRLANDKMQALFKKLEDSGDIDFIREAKAGLPVSYYSSWFGRHLTKDAKEALNKIWLANPDKQSTTFKNVESFFKGRVLTDLTTLEINSVIKRLQKEGSENANSIVSDVVAQFREGHKLNPTQESAATLVALAKALPEGIDFFHLDPIWATALSARDTERALSRKAIVDSIKSLGIAVWHGTTQELNAIKVGKNPKFAELENKISELGQALTKKQLELENLGAKTPDLVGNITEASIKKDIDDLVVKLAKAHEAKSTFTSKIGKGSVLDTMVDLNAEHVWIQGEDVTRMIDSGVISSSDIIGDPSDIFVRVPVKKYASLLDENNSEAFLFPKEIAGVVEKYFQTTTREGFQNFLAHWDNIHSIWKNWTLLPIPSYHVRNAISNSFMAYLGGVTDIDAYKKSFSIFKIVDGNRKGTLSLEETRQALGAISFATVDGKVVTGQQMYDAFVSEGGLSGGLHRNEYNRFGSVSRASEFERESVKAGIRPSSELVGSFLTDNAALRFGVSAAASIENNFRFAAFIDSIVKGHVEMQGGKILTGFEAAGMNMKKIFYDYSDLSAFERSWLRRVIPFYAWSRHNIPRMMQTLMTDPIKHYRLAEFFHEVEVGATDGNPPNPNELPQWMEGRFGLVVDKTPQGNYIVKTGDGFLPMIDAYKMLSGDGIVKMLRDGLTPFVKVPIEQLTNYSFYSERNIEQIPGQRAQSFTLGEAGFSRRATTEGPLGALNLILNESVFRTFFRPGGDLATKVIDPIFDGKEGPSIKLGIFGLLVGKAYEVNPAQARMAIYKDWQKRQGQLSSLRDKAMEIGDVKSVEDANRMMAWLSMQYPGTREK